MVEPASLPGHDHAVARTSTETLSTLTTLRPTTAGAESNATTETVGATAEHEQGDASLVKKTASNHDIPADTAASEAAADFNVSKPPMSTATSAETLRKPDPVGQSNKEMPASRGPTPAEKSPIIAWDDPRETRNPRNWSIGAKIFHSLIPSLLTFQIVFATSVTVPATLYIESIYTVSRTSALLPLSLYTLGLAFGPVVIASLSEVFGRKPIYVLSQTFFLAFIGGAAAAPNLASLLVFRLLAGLLGSAAIAIGAGSISDIWDITQQGGTAAALLYILAPFLGPTLGPLAGAYIMGDHGMNWRWTQYLLLILGAPLWVAALSMKETSKVWITRKDASLTRTATITGGKLKNVVLKAVTRPTKMLCTEVVVLLLSLYTAFAYAMIFSYFGSLSYVMLLWYGFDLKQIGLSFISVIIGYLLATFMFGAFDRTLYAKARAAAVAVGGKPNPKHRLYAACAGSIFLPISLFWYAWAAKEGGNWAVVVAAGIPFGLGAFSIFLSSIGYLADFYGPEASASAVAANGLLRYILGATFPLFTVQMYEKLGPHWASSVFAFLSLALLPIPWLLFRYSDALQRRSRMGMMVATGCDDVESRDSTLA